MTTPELMLMRWLLGHRCRVGRGAGCRGNQPHDQGVGPGAPLIPSKERRVDGNGVSHQCPRIASFVPQKTSLKSPKWRSGESLQAAKGMHIPGVWGTDVPVLGTLPDNGRCYLFVRRFSCIARDGHLLVSTVCPWVSWVLMVNHWNGGVACGNPNVQPRRAEPWVPWGPTLCDWRPNWGQPRGTEPLPCGVSTDPQ